MKTYKVFAKRFDPNKYYELLSRKNKSLNKEEQDRLDELTNLEQNPELVTVQEGELLPSCYKYRWYQLVTHN